jgi:polyhydroxyalkanoate synthase
MSPKDSASSISQIDPWSEPYLSISEKHPKEHYFEVYQRIFDSFPKDFRQLARDKLEEYSRTVWSKIFDPHNLTSPFEAMSNTTELLALSAGLFRGTLNYWHDEMVKLGWQEPSSAYRLGENVAPTPSEVVYSSDLLSLRRYQPEGATRAVPFVMFYSWINGYWILDLTKKLSLMRHLRDSGIDTYVTEWKIPQTAEGKNASLDDYLAEGAAALDEVSKLTGQRKLGVGGYCIGGVLADILAALHPARTAYLVNLTTALDTMAGQDGAGAFGAFTNFEIAGLEEYLARHGGIFPKKEFAEFFDNVKPKRAVRTFFERYVYGDVSPVDPVTYWNRKSAKEIYPVHAEFLWKLYNENALAEGRMEALGRPVDLKKITAPALIVMSEFDHIVPLGCALRTSHLIGTSKDEQRNLLVKGGHVRAIVSPKLHSHISRFISAHSGEPTPSKK